ncbi:hypothetical protein GCM10027570_54580 [Streptomonospora sediminis]
MEPVPRSGRLRGGSTAMRAQMKGGAEVTDATPLSSTDTAEAAHAATEEQQAAGIAERTLQMARERLAALDDLPAADHVAVFDELHQKLSTVLNGLEKDDGPRG